MPRDLSLTARQAVFAQETGTVFLILLTIDHSSLSSPLRFVYNNEDITSRGNTFTAFNFQIQLPSEEEDSITDVQLRIDNVDRQIVETVRSLSSAPEVTMEIVLSSDPDTVEAGPFNFELQEATYDAVQVTGTLGYPPVLDEPFPGDLFTPQNHPGLFSTA